MKRIIAILLALCCVFSVVACDNKGGDSTGGQELDTLAKFSAMFASSVPTKSVTEVTEEFGGVTLNSVYTLTTGTANGKATSIYTSSVETLNSIENAELKLKKTSKQEKWYYEGLGISTDKGRRWNADGVDFAPVAGSLALNLKEEYIEFYEYKVNDATETLYLEVTYEYATTVLSAFLNDDQVIDEDVYITVVAAGGRITSMQIEYCVYQHDVGSDDNSVVFDDMVVLIDVSYSYDIQDINITVD